MRKKRLRMYRLLPCWPFPLELMVNSVCPIGCGRYTHRDGCFALPEKKKKKSQSSSEGHFWLKNISSWLKPMRKMVGVVIPMIKTLTRLLSYTSFLELERILNNLLLKSGSTKQN